MCVTIITSFSFDISLNRDNGYKSGLIIPTTGFAHSLTSSAMDYKRDGLILGVGANTFKLAGSVLLYGILGSFFIGILGVIIHG